MKKDICNFLTDHTKWVFSGIGVLVISLIMNSTCSNGAEDKNPTVIITKSGGTNYSGTIIKDISGDISGTINSGDKVSGDKITAETINYGDKVSGDKVTAETIKYEEYKDNSRKIEVKDGNYIEHLQTSPSYREATIVRGDNGNPVGVRDNPDAIQNATMFLGKLMTGENVNIQEAYNATNPKFLINSETEVAILEYTGTGFAEFVKVKILEGTHKDEIGWIHASTIHHEQRQK